MVEESVAARGGGQSGVPREIIWRVGVAGQLTRVDTDRN